MTMALLSYIGPGAGIGGTLLTAGLLATLGMVVPALFLSRVLQRVGHPPAWLLLLFVPFLGLLLFLGWLAFAPWPLEERAEARA